MVVMGWSFGVRWQLVLEDAIPSSSIHQRGAMPRPQPALPLPSALAATPVFSVPRHRSGTVSVRCGSGRGHRRWQLQRGLAIGSRSTGCGIGSPLREGVDKCRKSAFFLEPRFSKDRKVSGSKENGRTDDEHAWQFDFWPTRRDRSPASRGAELPRRCDRQSPAPRDPLATMATDAA